MHTHASYLNRTAEFQSAMSDHDEHVCNCGATFDTLDELKEHAKENHPDAYEEKFED